jgi:hypothetical protein
VASKIRLALDQNSPILDRIAPFLQDIEFVPIRHIDKRMATLDDRQLVIALHQRKWAGLVTNNYRMLENPSELAAIVATRLSVFAVAGVGDDPIRATGAILLDLPAALKRLDSRKGQVFWMRPRQPPMQDPRVLFEQLAARRRVTYDELMAEVAVSKAALRRPVLDDLDSS